MVELPRLETLTYFGLWLLSATLIIVTRLLPLSDSEIGLPGPNLLLAMTAAWVLRRPNQIPAIVIVCVFLAEDLLFMRPPGLWALIVLVGTEFLRHRQSVARELNLVMEWGMVAAVLTAMLIANRVGLAIVMAPRPPLSLSVVELVFTVLAYPLVVVFLQVVFRVIKPATGEVDERGQKL